MMTAAELVEAPYGEGGTTPAEVLIIAAERSSRWPHKQVLEGEGYRVSEAASIAEVAGRDGRRSVSVVLLDGSALTPDIDALLHDAEGAETPRPAVLLVCDGDHVPPAESVFDEVLTKPVCAAELLWRVRSLLRLQDMRRELAESTDVRGEQARILSTLLDRSVALVGTAGIEEVLAQITSLAIELMHCRQAVVWLPDDSGGHLTIGHASGLPSDVPRDACIPVGHGWVGRVFQTGENRYASGPGAASMTELAVERAVFSAPPFALGALKAAGEVVGVLSVSGTLGRGPFGPRELGCMGLISNFAGTAIRETLVRQSRDQARDSIVFALATLAENRDSETGHHVERVTRFCLLLAKRLREDSPYRDQIDDAFLQALERAVVLHDIGKVAIPDSILLKPARLTPQEMSVMKSHAEVGWRAIRAVTQRTPGVAFLEMAADIAHGHHERYDGTGYPCGRRGQDIPLAARIVAVADVYDALTTQRPYKRPFSHEKARAIIEGASGSQFDPVVVRAFRQCAAEFADLARELSDAPATLPADPPAARIGCGPAQQAVHDDEDDDLERDVRRHAEAMRLAAAQGNLAELRKLSSSLKADGAATAEARIREAALRIDSALSGGASPQDVRPHIDRLCELLHALYTPAGELGCSPPSALGCETGLA